MTPMLSKLKFKFQRFDWMDPGIVLLLPSTSVSTDPAPYQRTTPKHLSSGQYAALRKGPRVNILVRSGDTSSIAVEGAFAHLLKYHSELANMALSADTQNFTVPYASKTAVVWAYKFMLSGEKDSNLLEPKFEVLGLQQLALLHGACLIMQYDFLTAKTFNRLKHLTGSNGCRDYNSFKTIYHSVPDLRDDLIKTVAKDKASTQNYVYISKVSKIPGVAEAVDVLMSEKVDKKQIKGQLPGSHIHKAKQTSAIVCYSCGQKGHIARRCTTKSTIFSPNIAKPTDEIDFRGAAKATVKQPFRAAPTCYNCRQVGHIARHCKRIGGSDSGCSSANSGHRNGHAKQRGGHGGSKFNRGVRYGQVIKVAGNGEGITTCDYEVKEGQYTRLGLKI